MNHSPHVISIHILDDDSLLNIFYLYRPIFPGFGTVAEGNLAWKHGHWWYLLAHVCQRWRNLILGFASYLRLSLVCTNGTPVANMLQLSPLLPLTVEYHSENGITAEDEEGLLLALEQRDRIRHLRLVLPFRDLQKLVMAIDEEFPILEYLIVLPWAEEGTALMLPETLQAPNLRHLALRGFACPIRPRLYPTAVGLVTLCLTINHPSTYFQPNILLQWISFMPQLENLAILFTFPVPNRDVERQLTQIPITTHITLPNLRQFFFQGVSAYLEAVVCRITTPRLEHLDIQFFKQLTFSVPSLELFVNTTENLRFGNAGIAFQDGEVVIYFPEADTSPFIVWVDCWHLDWQVSSVVQISNALTQVFSAVEHLVLHHRVHNQSSEEHNNVDQIEWRNLLRSFSNVKTLLVEDGLVEQLSRCLGLEDGESPLELLPELQELTHCGRRNTGDAFTSFIDARRNAGRPVSLVHLNPIPIPSKSPFVPAITSASGEAGNGIET